MEIKIIQERLERYKYSTKQEEKNALREIAQEIALCGLARTNFFKHTSFIGGSCLRIVHGLRRFSEDLDFWTFESNPHFIWQPYLHAVQEEFKSHAFDMVIEDRAKADDRMKRAFLKRDSIGKILILSHARGFSNEEKLTIKFEIDTNPPSGSQFETKNREFPSIFPITVLGRSSLFASKIAALFDREKEQKGRHWYDFVWYISHKWPLNFCLLGNCLGSSYEIKLPQLQNELAEIIKSINWELLKKDIRPFISKEDQETLGLWSDQYFLGYVDELEYLKPEIISLSSLIADGKDKALVEQVKEALMGGAFVDDDSRNGHRPLQIALSKGQRDIAQLLIEKGADVNYRDRSGQTPLQAAINHGEFEIAKLLIQRGAAFNPHAANLGFIYENLYQFLHFWQR